ncbi:MAG TPA: hypothetical protein VIK84_07200 [Haloplasmataceae bacterium]
MSLKDYTSIQPQVVKMLLNSFQKKRLAHAYLFEGEKGTKKKAIAMEFAKLLYCKDLGCNKCLNCQRIEHQNHPNVLIIESENNSIKKEQVIYLQKEYIKTTLEPGPKVYVIEGIENMSINAANSILKFIEEPADDTYTILITNNLHQILPTIISRCQVLNFKPIAKEEIIAYLQKNSIELYIARICSQLTNDVDKALEIANNEEVINIIDLVIIINQAILNKKENLLVLMENSKVDLYKNKQILEYFLDILLIYMRDIQNLHNNDEKITFINELAFIKEHLHLITKEKLIYNIKQVLEAKTAINYNVNTGLLVDHLMLNLM